MTLAMLLDYYLWLLRLPGFIPLYIHYSSPSGGFSSISAQSGEYKSELSMEEKVSM